MRQMRRDSDHIRPEPETQGRKMELSLSPDEHASGMCDHHEPRNRSDLMRDYRTDVRSGENQVSQPRNRTVRASMSRNAPDDHICRAHSTSYQAEQSRRAGTGNASGDCRKGLLKGGMCYVGSASCSAYAACAARLAISNENPRLTRRAMLRSTAARSAGGFFRARDRARE